MRAVVQRVTSARVTVDDEVVASIDEPGLVVLLGVTHDDGPSQVERLASKVWRLRIMRDESSASDLDAPLLVISQFTLYGDTRKGRRPTWNSAAPGEVSEPLYEAFCEQLRTLGAKVESGTFGAQMAVELVNDGPTTLIVDA